MGFINLIQGITAFNFILIAGLIFYFRNNIQEAIYVFAFFLLAKGITLSSNLVFMNSYQIEHEGYTYIAIIGSSFLFFYAPFLYFFALALSGKNIILKTTAIHLIPFFLFFIFKFFVLLTSYFSIELAVFETIKSFIYSNIVYVYYFQAFAYTLAAIKVLMQLGKTEGKSKESAKWLGYVLVMFLLVWSLFLGAFISKQFYTNYVVGNYLKLFGVLSLLVMSNLLLVMTIKNPGEIFKGFTMRIAKGIVSSKVVNKANYGLLCNTIGSQELYKKADLKLEELAEIAGLSSRNTSTIIKTYHGSNFYDFINAYRIDEAKKLLCKQDENLTILSILYEAGFNSKSVFNTVFKKREGLTPSEYKKSNILVNYG